MKQGYEKCEWSEATAILSPDGETVFEGEADFHPAKFWIGGGTAGSGHVSFAGAESLGFTPIKKRELEVEREVLPSMTESGGVVRVPSEFVGRRVRVLELPDESRDSVDYKPGNCKTGGIHEWERIPGSDQASRCVTCGLVSGK